MPRAGGVGQGCAQTRPTDPGARGPCARRRGTHTARKPHNNSRSERQKSYKCLANVPTLRTRQRQATHATTGKPGFFSGTYPNSGCARVHPNFGHPKLISDIRIKIRTSERWHPNSDPNFGQGAPTTSPTPQHPLQATPEPRPTHPNTYKRSYSTCQWPISQMVAFWFGQLPVLMAYIHVHHPFCHGSFIPC